MATLLTSKIIGKKISKLRFMPVKDGISAREHTLAVASWDDDDTVLQLWNLQRGEDEQLEPTLVTELKLQGDVAAMEFVDANTLVAATSSSDLIQFECSATSLTEKQRWSPREGCETLPYSDISVRQSFDGPEVAAVGEEGLIHRFKLSHADGPVQSIESGSDSLTCCSYLSQNEVAVGNLAGRLKIFDITKGQDIRSCLLRQDDIVGVTCILQHPSQPHLVFCGTETGSICVWDLRQEDQVYPNAYYNFHSVLIPELKFHALSTSHLLTVCYDGTALWWNASKLLSPFENNTTAASKNLKRTQNFDKSGWIMPDSMKDQVEINRLISPSFCCINSLDTVGDLVALGGDSEMLQVFSIPV